MSKTILILSLLFFFTLSDRASARTVNEMIYLVPAGKVSKPLIDMVRTKLPDALPITIKIIPNKELSLPESAYDAQRKQYNAEILAGKIAEQVELYVQDEWALVITEADIFAPDKDFIFGYADPKKKVCIVALARLRNEFLGGKPDDRAFRERILKMTIYELGRIWGIDDCSKISCVMHGPAILSDIDKKKNRFCIECRDKLLYRYTKPLINVPLKKIA